MLDTLDGAAVRRWARLAAQALQEHRAEIDLLNVYPIPDGDTGTNLCATFDAVAAAADLPDVEGSERIGPVLDALARAAVGAARGNSGAIASQVLRGLAEAGAGDDRWDGRGLQRGLRRAAELAYEAVGRPVEGTMLTVCRAAADAADTAADAAANAAAEAAGAAMPLAEVARSAARAAAEALARTPHQLPELARAGVVDAGGRGLAVVLAALATVVGGDDGVAGGTALPDLPRYDRPGTGPRSLPDAGADHPAGAGFEYEVQYQLAAPPAAAERLRGELIAIGDSVVMAGTGDGYWLVHVHVDDIGAAVEAGIRAGTPSDIRVTRFADRAQPSGPALLILLGVEAGPATAPEGASEDLAAALTSTGAVVLDAHTGPADVSNAIGRAGGRPVVLVPVTADFAGAAEAAGRRARGEGVEVAVVPAQSPVQALAAVAVHDPARLFGEDVVAMAEAAAATRYAEVARAEADAFTSAGPCRAGDVLGLIDGDVVEIGHDLEAVTLRLVERLLGAGGEMITLVVGADGPAGLGAAVRRHVAGAAIGCEVSVYSGGPAPVLIGVE